MRRTILFVIGGLLVGGIIHVAIVFLVPYYAGKDAYSAIGRMGSDGQFHLLPMAEAGAEAMPATDPHFMEAVCRFDLHGGPIRVLAAMPDEFWSVAVFDKLSRNVYSLTDRAVDGSNLDLALLTSVQNAQMRQNPPESLNTAIVLELPIDAGFIVLRALVPDDSLRPAVTAALAAAQCSASL
ncbi:MAG TPA: DUF1254 domain-containing protein [Bauldia sp.]|nr:DUF1254 domain-containing protein [Bauldia sp.]